MHTLLFQEWRRMRMRIAAVAALVTLGYLSALFGASLPPNIIYDASSITIASLSGMVLGLAQALPYRHAAQWAWLCTRPVTQGQRFGAMAAVGLSGVLASVCVPQLLLTLGLHLSGREPFDSYHLVQFALALLIAMAGWSGGFILLWHPNPWARLLIAAPAILAFMPHTLLATFLAFAGFTLVTLIFSYSLFNTDRAGATRTVPMRALQAAMLYTPAWCVAIVVASLLSHKLFPIHWPSEMESQTDPYEAFWSTPGAYDLAKSDHPDAPAVGAAIRGSAKALRDEMQSKQAERAYKRMLERWSNRFPRQEEPISPFKAAPSFTDKIQNIVWRYNFDHRRFHGTDLETGEDRGWLPGQAFQDVPTIRQPEEAAVHLLDGQRLDRYDQRTRQTHTLARAPEGQHFHRVLQHLGDTVLLVAERELMLVPQVVDAQHPVIHLPRQTDLPLGKLTTERLQGAFVITQSFVDEIGNDTGRFTSLTQVLDDAGTPIMQGRSKFDWRIPNDDFFRPVISPAKWLTPLGIAFNRHAGSIEMGGMHLAMPIDQMQFLRANGICALVSAISAWIWLLGSAASRRTRIVWSTLAALLGPALVLVLIVLEPRHRGARQRASLATA